jgi:hypothetical protein
MKTLINSIIVLAVSFLTPQITRAQGTVFVSNMGQPSTGSMAVGSDSWLASGFISGTNSTGYVLNSVQLAMADASGDPSNFTVMIYGNSSPAGIDPGNIVGTLVGSLNPATIGTYTYTDDSNIVLSPQTQYFIVLTSGTAIANGAYEWSLADANFYSRGVSWGAEVQVWTSGDGSSWGDTSGRPQYAIIATAVPEPSTLGLLGFGGLSLLWHRRKAKAVNEFF